MAGVGLRHWAIDNHSHSRPHCGPRHHIPSPVYVCVCSGITDHQIREVAQAGCRTVSELTMRTGAGANCGSCLDIAAQLLDDVHATKRVPLPVLSEAA